MYTELTEDTLQNIVNENEKSSGSIWRNMVRKLQNHEAEIQKLASENDSIPFYM